MPSTYTLNNGIELIGTGEQSGTWGATTNTNLGLLDAALDGQVTLTLAAAGSSGSPNALPITDGTTSNGRNRMVVFADGGDLGATAYVQLTPNDAEKIIYIRNSLSGSRSVILFQGTYNASNDYEVPAGTTAVVYFDGAGAGAVAANVFNNAHFDAINVVGTVTATTVTATTVNATTVDAVTVEFDNLSGTGAVSVTNILDEDNMASDSATALATQQSIKAYVDAQVGTVDTLAEILAIGNTTGATDIAVDSAQKVQFRDAAIYINSSVDGQLDIVADTEIQIAATTVDLNGNLDVSGTALVTGVLTTTATQVATGGITSGSSIISDTDSTDSLGSTGVRWLKGWFDTLTAGTLTIGSGSVTDSSGAISFGNENLTTTGIVTAAGTSVFTNLDISGDIDVDGTTNLDVVDIDGATQIDATVTVGVDDTGYDVKFFGATAGAYMLWDESADDLILGGAAGLSVNSAALVTGVLTTTAATVSNGGGQFNGAINVGVDDTGYDVKFFGATTGKSLLWDESADSLTVAGNLSVDGGTIKLDGNYPVGTGNVALGDTALDSLTTGEYNTALGAIALTANTSGSYSTAVGYVALRDNTTGLNSAFGAYAAYQTTTGTNNTALGASTLDANTTGSYNTAVGHTALYANTTASSNTAVGYQAAYTNTTGASLVAMGQGALYSNTTGTANIAIGYDIPGVVPNSAMYSNTTGVRNVAVGGSALSSNTTGSYNTAIGGAALYSNTTVSYNTAVGYQAGYTNTTGGANTAIGYQALLSNTTASNNTAVGYAAMYDNSTGQFNLASGYLSLENNTTGNYNTALGAYALDANTTASNNTAVGYKAGYSITTSELGVYIGSNTGESVTTGSRNTMVGVNAGASTTTGTGNTFIGGASTGAGNGAGKAITTGSKNTILGTYDGNQGDLDIRTSDNNIVLSDGDGNPRVHIDSAGDIRTGAFSITGASEGSYYQPFYGITWSSRNSTGSQNHRYFVNPNGPVGSISTSGSATAYNTSSDYRLKENVVYDWDATTRLKQLKPARFNFIADADTTVDGFLAHEAQAVVPECVTGTKDAVDADGVAVMQGIDQSKLVPLLVKTIQELEARITALENL
jgi:hypothetical protein